MYTTILSGKLNVLIKLFPKPVRSWATTSPPSKCEPSTLLVRASVGK